MKFLLDTDTCIYALKQNTTVLRNLLAQKREDVMVSVITEAELRTGAARALRRRRRCDSSRTSFVRLASLTSRLPMLRFTLKCGQAWSEPPHPLVR